MKILFILLICLSTPLISADISHTQTNPKEPSSTESHNPTGNDPSYVESRATPDDARRLIEKAITYLNEHGEKKAFAAFNDPNGEFCYKDAYVFVVDMNGLVLAHGGDFELVGTNQYYLKDSVGKYFIQEFIQTITEQDEGWLKYKWLNYETFEIESKLTLLKRYNSIIFLGCGIYCSY